MITITATLPTLAARQVLATCSHLGGKPSETDLRTTVQRMADGLVQLAVAYAKGQVRGGRENPNLVITVTAEAMAGLTNDPGTTAWGDRIPAHVLRQLAANAVLQRVIMAGSHVLDVGREVRFATVAQYRALVARDGCCRWDGCTIPAAWCDIDHLTPWEHGGTTTLTNLVMFCRFHHHQRHQPHVTIHGDAHHLHLQLADGTIIHCRPKAATRALQPDPRLLHPPPDRTTTAAA